MIRRLGGLLAALAMASQSAGPVSASGAWFGGLMPGFKKSSAGGGGGGSMSLTYKGTYNDETDLTTYTKTGADLGTAESGRVIIVVIGCAAATSQTISSVTIGGVTATGAVTNPASTRTLDFYYAVVPTGSTGDIAVTASSTMSRCRMDWWAVTGTDETTYAARSGANPVVTTASSATSASITVPSGGASIAAVVIGNTAGGPLAWTADNGSPSERTDALVGTTSLWMSAADSTAVGAIAYTADGGDSMNYRIASIAWGP